MAFLYVVDVQSGAQESDCGVQPTFKFTSVPIKTIESKLEAKKFS